MDSFSIKSARPYGVIIAACVTLAMAIFGIVTTTQAHAQAQAEQQAQAEGARLISIHEDGQTRGILTESATLRDAFKQAGITVDENDLVEPGLDEELVATQYDVNIYRARPLTIVDGSVRMRIVTPHQTAHQIAKAAGLTLRDEDTTQLTATVGLRSQATGMQMTIDRATPVQFIMYGKKITAYTQATTVDGVLREKSITLGDDDTLSVAGDTPITAGMTIELWREGKQVITEDEVIDFPVEKIRDANREKGYRDIKTAGVKGERTVSYEIVMKNGKEISRKEIRSVTTKQPKKQVEVIGTKTRIAPYTGGGTLTEWLTAAGIPESDWKYVQYIAQRESGLNPNATNPTSGACGLIQAYPCSKVPGNPYNPVDNLKWANDYAHTCVSYRMYCGWEGAYQFWSENNWW